MENKKMSNKENFLKLVSGEDTKTIAKVKERIKNREMLRKLHNNILNSLLRLDELRMKKNKLQKIELIIDYKEIHMFSSNLYDVMKNYVINNDEVNASYHRAKSFISELNQKSYRNIKLRNNYIKWMKFGSTLRLMDILKDTSYNDSDIIDSNAFFLLDVSQSYL